MTDATLGAQPAKPSSQSMERVAAGLKRRHAEETRFRLYGIGAITIAAFMLVWLLFTIIAGGYSAFFQTRIVLDVPITADLADPRGDGSPESLQAGDYRTMFRSAAFALFPEIEGRARSEIAEMFSGASANQLRNMVLADPGLVGQTVPIKFYASGTLDQVWKGKYANRDRLEEADFPFDNFPFSQQEYEWMKALDAQGRVSSDFNWNFLSAGPSNSPEVAGLGGAMMGSLLTLLVTLALAFPVGVCAAIYLEEFAPKNRLTDIIEVNINNLAAVPSIIFGLLGLAMFLNFFGMPRHTPVVGGMVIALMTLPTIIIASRAALKAVPPSIRQGALAMGASRVQTITHHVLPLALPGMLTGTIIGMAAALGETAPLLLIGMNAFIADSPSWFTDPATVIPVQIYIWANEPARAFVEKTSAAIMVLLAFLVAMNIVAVLLRKKFERRW